MKAREKENPERIFSANIFNVHGIGEVIGYDETFGCDLFYIKDLEVLLVKMGTRKWKDMQQAFKDHDLIMDNYNTRFLEPKNEEDRTRGFTV